MPRIADVVLEESLVREFFNFYTLNPKTNHKIVLKLLEYYKPFFVTMPQLEDMLPKEIIQRVNSTIDSPWVVYSIPENSRSSQIPVFNSEILKEMTMSSNFGICLTDKLMPAQNNFRFVNIFNTNLKSNYTERYAANHPREDFHRQLKHILNTAKKIEIYDYYLKIKDLRRFVSLIDTSNLPNIDIHVITNTGRDANVTKNDIYDAFKGAKSVRVALYKKKTMHDRYIKINNKIEILITSGFEYLFNNDKECSYIISNTK